MNEKEGKGTLIYRDGTQYIGDFLKGKKDGKGELIKPDGSVYKGEW